MNKYMLSQKTKKERKISDNLEYIGACGVDSGQLMITDPCYALDDTNYQKVSDATLKNQIDNIVIKSVAGNCIAFSTNTGDGVYPVYVERHKDGKQIKRVIIELDCWN